MPDLMPDEPFDEFKTVVRYPPDPPRPCGSDPINMYGGKGKSGAELARHRQEYHRANGATSATVYRRTWTPGPWMEVRDA